ncbi:hypothetical protein [Bacillus massiliglaciei]|uniref:hypothetical protein n=1 Tax=Bacillus massiliglaciei TaxID=1816693 RepID=UPI000DA5EF4D|nr:hypothetical protein [Bacillus massiliglaciei]
MQALTENHFLLFYDIYELILTLEETFQYIAEHFNQLSLEEEEVLLRKILQAFGGLEQAERRLEEMEDVLQLPPFSPVLDEVERLGWYFGNAEARRLAVRDRLLSVFTEWAEAAKDHIRPIIIS